MSNTINLLPVRTKDQIKTEFRKFKYDFITSIVILGVVLLGIFLMFIHAFLEYNLNQLNSNITKQMNVLKTYQNFIHGYQIIDEKAQQVKLINKNKVDPADVINYMYTLIPSGSTLSNFALDEQHNFTVTIASSNYIDIARFLVILENPQIRLTQTEIKGISFSKSQNIYNFVISGTYVKPNGQ